MPNQNDKEVEELAREMYWAYYGIELEVGKDIESGFFLQMAEELISKGYRRTDSRF